MAALFWAGLGMLVIAALARGSLGPSAMALLLAAFCAGSAAYSLLTFRWTSDGFLTVGWRGWWFGRPYALPHRWWAVVGAIWSALFVVAVVKVFVV